MDARKSKKGQAPQRLEPGMRPLLVPGRNCWRVERAQRLAFIIDGAEYFAAVRSAVSQAKRSVFIVGWDFDSRIRLARPGVIDSYPEELGDFLKEVVRRERHFTCTSCRGISSRCPPWIESGNRSTSSVGAHRRVAGSAIAWTTSTRSVAPTTRRWSWALWLAPARNAL
jgi:hypothetical protein